MSYNYKLLPHACSLPAPGAFWPRWFYEVLHPGFARMRNTLHCPCRQACHFKTSEFRRDRNAKYAIVTRRPIHSYAKWQPILFEWKHHCSVIACHPPWLFRNTSERSSTWLSPTRHANIRMDICQMGYDICEFDSLRGLGIGVIGRVHFDNRDRFAIWMGSIGDRTMSANEWLLTSDVWQFLEPWHGRWYEYEIVIASCTDNIYDLENERWLLGDMIDHVGIYGSRVAEGLSAFNVGLVLVSGVWVKIKSMCLLMKRAKPEFIMLHWLCGIVGF